MTPTLFLRASEVGNNPVVALPAPLNDAQSPALGVSRARGAEMAPDLLVPQVRPGLEFVLEGRGAHTVVKRGRLCIEGDVPVRAFEIIAGEEGRVVNERLQIALGDGRWGNFDRTWPADVSPPHVWEEPWDNFSSYVYLSGRMHAYPKDGPVYLIGPSVRGNPYKLERHELRRPKELKLDLAATGIAADLRTPEVMTFFPFECVKLAIEEDGLYGIQWRLGDEPVAQVLREEMGLTWP